MLYRKTVRGAALVALLALTVPACATDRGGSDAVPGNAAGDSATAAAEKFGTLDSPCGEGDAKGATDKGVTDTEIRIGYGDDRGFSQSPGLNKEMGDAVEALVAWCNEQGGINGRKVVGNLHDAAMTQANTAMQDACRSDFMLVGHGFAYDGAAEQTRIACKLPMVPGFTVSPHVANAPMSYQAMPFPADYVNTGIWHNAVKLYPELKKGLAVVNHTSPALVSANAKSVEGWKSAGVKPLDCGVTLNYAGESSYVPFAEKYKSCGADGLWNSRSATPSQFNLLQAVDQVGLDPVLFFEATWYTDAVAKWNTAGLADKLHVGMQYQPFENASEVPAVKAYTDLVTAEGGKTSLLGMQAASSFLLWATAAEQCGSELTRQCVVDKLSAVHEWTGGGLHAATDPGANLPSECVVVLRLTKNTWKQTRPAEAGEFDCDDSYLFRLSKKNWGTELNKDRISTEFLTDDVIEPQA
ncbi:ABC transporter substrate-binding protein [Streptomyces sp. NPDC059506]|uniref:ABC transporter substrate-binding protein n=1 Tax=unclassified Streptomyces TaxID=2593676 RepID=UPI001C715CE0|nr:ABC transporter substrate-binding protein [Streptomyces sp. SCUT-3]